MIPMVVFQVLFTAETENYLDLQGNEFLEDNEVLEVAILSVFHRKVHTFSKFLRTLKGACHDLEYLIKILVLLIDELVLLMLASNSFNKIHHFLLACDSHIKEPTRSNKASYLQISKGRLILWLFLFLHKLVMDKDRLTQECEWLVKLLLLQVDAPQVIQTASKFLLVAKHLKLLGNFVVSNKSQVIVAL